MRVHTCAGGLSRALKGVKSVVALGRLGALLPAAQRAGVERVVLLSTAGEKAGLPPTVSVRDTRTMYFVMYTRTCSAVVLVSA